MPCSGVDFLLAPTQHREFERSILIDDTSLWLRGDGLKEFYTQFLQNHLSSNDFAIAATWVASFIADFSSQYVFFLSYSPNHLIYIYIFVGVLGRPLRKKTAVARLCRAGTWSQL